ncbi:MAG: hypothetical protein IPO56_16615 [Flavobacteriales bacterium]|nr:hypothetical protein [Flavobacteriales bacterium]
MGPSIILDKNALPGLSFLEVQALHRFYLVNIPPVLVKEVIGDMAKLTVKGTPEEEVTQLARKMLPQTIVVNAEFSMMVQGECVGYEIGLTCGRSVINAVPTETSGGASGFFVPEGPEALALGRWRNNEFRDGDRLMGELWRRTTTDAQAVADIRRWWQGTSRSLDGLPPLKRRSARLIDCSPIGPASLLAQVHSRGVRHPR